MKDDLGSVEEYLRRHWYATKRIGQLMMELTMARKAYEQSYEGLSITPDYASVRHAKRRSASPVEHSALVVIDQHRAEVERVERRIQQERLERAQVEKAVACADLAPRESDYVRLRYYKNLRAESVAQRMYCSPATCRRIRQAALRKVAGQICG